MKKYFKVNLMHTVFIPYEEGLLQNGIINNNHLTFLALKKLKDNINPPSQSEIDIISCEELNFLTSIPISWRSSVQSLTLQEAEFNKNNN